MCGVIPNSIEFIYSIEGCDYLKSEDDLDELYKLGLRSILPDWNEKNKFGSSFKSEEGLTDLGKKLILRAIELGIMIDVSHANLKTFNDILEIIELEKAKGKDINVIASHSNLKTLCKRERNLSDTQLIRLKDIGGYIGIFTNGKFLSLDNKKIGYEKRQENFIKHLDYILNKIKFPEDKIVISSDDMNFSPDTTYHNSEAFYLPNISVSLRRILKKYYKIDFVDKVMIDNSKKLIKKLNNKSVMK